MSSISFWASSMLPSKPLPPLPLRSSRASCRCHGTTGAGRRDWCCRLYMCVFHCPTSGSTLRRGSAPRLLPTVSRVSSEAEIAVFSPEARSTGLSTRRKFTCDSFVAVASFPGCRRDTASVVAHRLVERFEAWRTRFRIRLCSVCTRPRGSVRIRYEYCGSRLSALPLSARPPTSAHCHVVRARVAERLEDCVRAFRLYLQHNLALRCIAFPVIGVGSGVF